MGTSARDTVDGLLHCRVCGSLIFDPDQPCPHCVRMASPEYRHEEWTLFFNAPIPPAPGQMYRSYYVWCRRCSADLKRGMTSCPCCLLAFRLPVPKHLQDGLPDRPDPGIFCRKCEATLIGGEGFCPGCGTKFEEPVPPPPGFIDRIVPLGFYACPRCQARLSEGAQFCGGCGGKLRNPVPPVDTRTEIEPNPEVWETPEQRQWATERLRRGETFRLNKRFYPFNTTSLAKP